MGGLVGVFWSRRMGELSGDMSRADKVGPERVLVSLQDSWATRRRPSLGEKT
jgi:hypothetical protein